MDAQHFFFALIVWPIVNVVVCQREPDCSLIIAEAPGLSNELAGSAERTETLAVEIVRRASPGNLRQALTRLLHVFAGQATQDELEAIARDVAGVNGAGGLAEVFQLKAGLGDSPLHPILNRDVLNRAGVLIFESRKGDLLPRQPPFLADRADRFQRAERLLGEAIEGKGTAGCLQPDLLFDAEVGGEAFEFHKWNRKQNRQGWNNRNRRALAEFCRKFARAPVRAGWMCWAGECMPFRQADSISTAAPATDGSPQPARLRGTIVAGVVAFILLGHWILGTAALRDKCTTCDEIAHVTAGCSYWLKNDYRLQPENGNLPQRWHALTAAIGGAKLPAMSHGGWVKSDIWKLGRSFFYDEGNGAEWLLARGRAMAALFSVATCLVVFLWSRQLFGTRGGLLSLVLAALCPAMLAHGPLMTSDMCLTLFLLLSTWSVWELLHTITPLRLAGGMLAIAGLFLAKFSAVLILPIAAVLVLVRLFSREAIVVRWDSWSLRADGQAGSLPYVGQAVSLSGKLGASFAVTVLCGLFAYGAVWAAYGFRYSAFAEGELTDASFFKLKDVETACAVVPGRGGKVIGWLASRRVLPEAYLYGAAYVLAHQKRAAFWNGEYAVAGWRGYFPYCFLVKTPLALFGLLGIAVAALSRRERRPVVAALQGGRWYQLTPLIVLLAVYWLAAIQTTLNIGYRHILPVYPVLYIVAGAAAWWLTRAGHEAGLCFAKPRHAARVAVALLVGVFALESTSAYPNYLAYFNPLVPRERAHEHLVDSNLDWGQDLPGLSRWLSEHNDGPENELVYLAYFGNGRPAYYGIEAVELPPPVDIRAELPFAAGLYCISATSLVAVYEDAPGRWNKAYEERYEDRRRQFTRMAAGECEDDANSCAAARSAFEYGKYLRLLAYLRHRRPDADVGHSILIFRVTAAEISQALEGPPAELDEKPWLPQRVKHL